MIQDASEKDPQQGPYPPLTQDSYTSCDNTSVHLPGGYQDHSQAGSVSNCNVPPQETHLSPPNTEPYQTFASAPDASPTSAFQDNQQGGSLMPLGTFYKGPPPMWRRQPPPPGQLLYNAFPPICLISNSKDLSNGFPELPPPCQLNPHPFATHDVAEEDWRRFLADVKKAASLSTTQRIISGVIPLVTGINFVTGFFVTHIIEKKMKYKNRQAAGDLVDHWNHYFFGPRRMQVVLCQASERLSGRLDTALIGDPNQQRTTNNLRQPTDSSLDGDSSSDDNHEHGHSHNRGHGELAGRQACRAAKRERRKMRRERQAEQKMREARGENRVPYQLFITSL